jgi:YggT family protein
VTNDQYLLTRLQSITGIFFDISQEHEPSMSSSIVLLTQTLSVFIQVYSWLLIIRILLTWFPTVNWYNQPFAALSQVTDPYLNIFRSIIPPLGGMDFSPILAFVVLNVVSGLISSLAGAALQQPF